MNYFISLPVLLTVGTLGGLLGAKLKIPAGALIGAMLSVIIFKLIFKADWSVPRVFTFVLQVFLGVMVAATFQPEMLKTVTKIAIPVAMSTMSLVGVGVLLAIIFNRMGLIDFGTAYLGTSPGAMSALIVMAFDNQASPTLVTCFHFFRVVFIILTAPLIFKLLS